jgi:hypothetical protein
MAEMGFEPGTIVEVTGLARGTVNDIIRGHGSWGEMADNELITRTSERVRRAIENAADTLALKAMARLEDKIEKATLMEACSILNALGRIGGWTDEQR